MNAGNYVELLESILLNFTVSPECIKRGMLQLTALSVPRGFFESKTSPVLKWPAVSPDLNPIENLWSILIMQVYNRAREFISLLHLKKAIQRNEQNSSLVSYSHSRIRCYYDWYPLQ